MGFDAHQIAYCGLYCPQCSIRAAYETGNRAHVQSMPARYDRMKDEPIEEYRCECCKGDSACGPCTMRDCAGAKGLISCADCADFPCAENDRFDADDSPHHSWAVANLYAIRQMGYDAWFETQKAKMACPTCGARLSWYYACPNCGG